MNLIDREMLLGYLMNALEDDEISSVERELLRQPKLRTELATLQKELSPLDLLYEPVEPPRDLARRTCDRIWTSVEREEKVGRSFPIAPELPTQIVSISIKSKKLSPHTQSETWRDSVIRPFEETAQLDSSLDEIVTVSPALENEPRSDREKTDSRRLVRRVTQLSRRNERRPLAEKKEEQSLKTKGKHKRAVDLLASVAVGIMIAVVAFPALNFAKNRTHYLVKQNKIKEINRGVELYAQLQGADTATAAPEQPQSVNLARSGWQEVHAVQAPILTVAGENRVDLSSPATTFFQPVSSGAAPLTTYDNAGRDIFLGQAPGNPVKIDPKSLAHQTLLADVHGADPLYDSSTVQTAFGQNVLFHNGRVFFRVLPVFSQTEE